MSHTRDTASVDQEVIAIQICALIRIHCFNSIESV